MIFLKDLQKIEDDKYYIGYTHYNPFDEIDGLGKTKEELEKEGVLLENIPQPLNIQGRVPMMYYNPQRREIFYEQIEIDDNDTEHKEIQEKETFTKALAQLTIENKKKDAMIVQLAQQVNVLNIKINQQEVK